ncbi:hypothetical protein GE09DRAFT_1148745 [Coniochaeta sp. 2T2.1]|nr:hypothetical protein GE09DRAFT_1148745 [Coniochaeta sp. 2T2.1]
MHLYLLILHLLILHLGSRPIPMEHGGSQVDGCAVGDEARGLVVMMDTSKWSECLGEGLLELLHLHLLLHLSSRLIPMAHGGSQVVGYAVRDGVKWSVAMLETESSGCLIIRNEDMRRRDAVFGKTGIVIKKRKRKRKSRCGAVSVSLSNLERVWVRRKTLKMHKRPRNLHLYFDH